MAQGSRQVQTQAQQQIQTLSPQQILVVKLLELPAVELEDRVRAELLENPALEEGKEDTPGDEYPDTPDAETGLQWLLKAAEMNSDKAQFELGNAYLSGNGVEENDEIAMEWFEKAAENGNEKALKITGRRKR